jgi:hypothetical protein
MTIASRLILRNVDPKTFHLYNRALAEQGLPTLNRANRRATAKVIERRERRTLCCHDEALLRRR